MGEREIDSHASDYGTDEYEAGADGKSRYSQVAVRTRVGRVCYEIRSMFAFCGVMMLNVVSSTGRFQPLGLAG